MMAARFLILLNSISSRLNEQEIRSMMLMCNVPEGLRAGMKDGISLFDNLIKRDIINEHKLDHLKMVLTKLNPKRRDLIREIENFENGTQTQDDASSTLNSVTGSSLPSTIRPDIMREPCCTLDCPCIVISCYKYGFKISWSYIVFTAFFLICVLILTLLWYADVPKVSEAIASDEHVKKAGPFILTATVVLFVAACLLSMCYVKKRGNRRSNQSATLAANQNQMQEVGARRSTVDDVEDNMNDTSNFGEDRLSTSMIEVNSSGTSSSRDNLTGAGFSNLGFSRYMNDSGNVSRDSINSI